MNSVLVRIDILKLRFMKSFRYYAEEYLYDYKTKIPRNTIIKSNIS